MKVGNCVLERQKQTEVANNKNKFWYKIKGKELHAGYIEDENDINHLCELLQSNPHITSVTLPSTNDPKVTLNKGKINSESFIKLIQTLNKLNMIISFKVTGYPISDERLCELAKSTTLRSLKVWNCGLTVNIEECPVIPPNTLDALLKNKSLESLTLNFTLSGNVTTLIGSYNLIEPCSPESSFDRYDKRKVSADSLIENLRGNKAARKANEDFFFQQIVTLAQGAKKSQPDNCYLRYLPAELLLHISSYLSALNGISNSDLMCSLVLFNFGILNNKNPTLKWFTAFQDNHPIFKKPEAKQGIKRGLENTSENANYRKTKSMKL